MKEDSGAQVIFYSGPTMPKNFLSFCHIDESEMRC
jgi:hypothetical protein